MTDPAHDPGLRASLMAARAWGVSPSRFFGRPSESVTVHEYGADGRLVRSVTTHDPDWTDEDRDLAWSLQAWEAQACPGCGGHLPETTLPEHEESYEASAMLCHRCAAIGREQAKRANHQAPQALVVSARLREAGS